MKKKSAADSKTKDSKTIDPLGGDALPPLAKLPYNPKPRKCHQDDWKLDRNYKSASMKLTNGDVTGQIDMQGHSYVLGTKGMNRGRHAWRTHILALNNVNWIFIGVGTKKYNGLSDRSFGEDTAWGYSSTQQTYTGGLRRLKQRDPNYRTEQIDWVTGTVVDVLLDCDARTLQFHNCTTRRNWTLSQLPEGTKWYPHFNLFGAANRFKVEVIPVSVWGNLSAK